MKKKKVRKTKERAVRKNRNEESASIKIVTTIISIFFVVFVALSNFSMCGSIGEIVRSIVLGAFGTLGYILPVILSIAIIISLSNDRKTSNMKIYSLIILYIAIICLIETLIHDFSIENDIADCINATIIRAKNLPSVDPAKFSGGVIGTGISFITYKAISKGGSIALFSTVAIISFLLIFGTGISKVIIKVLGSIIMFIPNLIKRNAEKREEDRQIAIDNENILKNTIEKSKKVNLGVSYEYDEKEEPRLTLEPLKEREMKHFDTSKLNITPSDVQSRFYNVDEEAISEKNQLLREMRKKSINEIMYEHEEVKPSSFFYTDGMKPVDEMKNIEIPAPKFDPVIPPVPTVQSTPTYSTPITNKTINDNIYEEENETNDSEMINNDAKSFASGLDELREESDTLDIKNKTSHEILENTTKDIEVKNNTIRNDSLFDKETARVKRHKKYKFPPYNILSKSEKKNNGADKDLNEKATVLVETLRQFGVGASITNITVGPSVTRFELKPDLGVKVSKILSLEDDVKLALAASEIRIEAPIPGKSAIGIEIPNTESSGVTLGDIINTPEFKNAESKLTVAIGKDISGKVIVTDLRKMPHLLIAGATGSGKSVCINSLITSLIYKSSPEDVRLIMVDPKVVELQIYDGIPHLLVPVVTNPKKAAGALNWAVNEMTRRYNLIQEKRVRDIESYNRAIEGELSKISVNEDNEAELEAPTKLPYIVIIIDEFADLMLTSAKEVENSIMRIAQLARACGIYLVIATQRPSVNVISGSIKTNVPSRISFAVASGVDSQTILDRRGAEKLLGHGDMLYFPQGIPEPVRVQGCFVSEQEILNVVDYVKDSGPTYDIEAETAIEKTGSGDGSGSYGTDEKDDLYVEAGKLIIEQQSASIGMLQRRFRLGFNRAARIIDQLEANGVLSKQDGKKPREVLMTMEEFLESN